MTLRLDEFARNLRGTRSPRTASAYERTARAFLAFLGKRGEYPQPNDVERFLARPLASGRPRSASTRNHDLAGIRAFATFMKKQGIWHSDPTNDIPFAKESRKDPTFLICGELRQLFEAAANDSDYVRRARSLAIIALLSQLGLRVHELVGLNTSQLDLPSRTLLGVHGKGDTRIDLPLSDEVTWILAKWTAIRAAWAASEEPALFIAKKSGRRISIRSVQRLIDRLWSKCGSAKRITPHSLRHTTATLSITLGTDISSVGDLLRHSSLDITRKYIGLVGARRRAAVETLAVTIPQVVLPEVHRKSRSVDRSPRPVLDICEGVAREVQNPIDVQESLDDAA